MRAEKGLRFGAHPRLCLDCYHPAGAGPHPAVVFFYGGAWRGGRRGLYAPLGAALARAGITAYLPDYRLFPDVAYPDFLADCAQAVAWAQARRAADRVAGPLFLMGHSAGAYNAAMLALDRQWLAAAGGDAAGLAGMIGLAGPYDFLPITRPDVAQVFPAAGPATQPVSHVRAGAPPLLLLHGAADSVVKPRQALALAARQREAGGEAVARIYPGLAHIGILTSLAWPLRWRAPVWRDMLGFIAGHGALQPRGPVPKPAAALT